MVTLDLDADEALVFFEFLNSKVEELQGAEALVVDRQICTLEAQVSVLFDDNYAAQVGQARARVLEEQA